MKFITFLCLTLILVGCSNDEVVPTLVPATKTAVSPISPPIEPTTAPITNAASPAEADPSKITPSPVENDDPHVAPQPGVPGSPLDTMTMLIVDDLAEQNNSNPQKITVVSTNSREWSDSGLGCQQEGGAYLMVITPGYQIVLELDGQEYTYHTDEKQSFILCTENK